MRFSLGKSVSLNTCDGGSVSNGNHQGISGCLHLVWCKALGWQMPTKMCPLGDAQDSLSPREDCPQKCWNWKRDGDTASAFSALPTWLYPLMGTEGREEEGDTLLQKKVLSQNTVSRT